MPSIYVTITVISIIDLPQNICPRKKLYTSILNNHPSCSTERISLTYNLQVSASKARTFSKIQANKQQHDHKN